MKPLSFMIVAGEASGDLLAAELVVEMRKQLAMLQSQFTSDLQPLETSLVPRFFGAGGPRLRDAGVELAIDMTDHSVIGLDALKKLAHFRGCLGKLFRLAIEREPDAIICVDSSGFNLRLAARLRSYVRSRSVGAFFNWHPKIIQYVSPQVWASRPRRAAVLERNVGLLLSIFPFEKDWYAVRAPKLHVEYVGHPVVDRYASLPRTAPESSNNARLIALLPGSREGELHRHLPMLCEAAHQIAGKQTVQFDMPLPGNDLVQQARQFKWPDGTEIHEGGLPDTLQRATIALASTGTVTMECAHFGVPTVAFYKTSWLTYEIGKRIVTIAFLAMPNLLAGQELFPEFIQHRATPDNLASAALELLNDEGRRKAIREKLRKIIASLGPPGAARRSARTIINLVHPHPPAVASSATLSIGALQPAN